MNFTSPPEAGKKRWWLKGMLVIAFCVSVLPCAWAQKMCPIQGNDGTCSVSIDAYHLSHEDCSKYNEIKYVGVCRNGNLHGVILLRVSTIFNGENFYSQQLSNFDSGAVVGLSVTYQKNSLGYEDHATRSAGNCVNWGDADFRAKKPACIQAGSTFSGDVMSKAFWEKVTKNLIGPAQLPRLASNTGKDAASNQLPVGTDDPKTLGRGMRGG